MLKAVLFDLDGVIIDTERNGHRVAFNKAFEEFGYADAQWDEELYHRLLQVGGGKERVRHYFAQFYDGPRKPEDMDAFVAGMHKRKTEIFVEMLRELPLRPGVRRFMGEIRDRGLKLGICTTSNERVANTVAREILKDMPFALVIAGDAVKRKKPDPEIYTMALGILGIPGGECLVVEDSHIGVRAAKAAGCNVLSTYNGYTRDEDLSAADFIVSCLGDPDGEKAEIGKEKFRIDEDGVVRLSLIEAGF